ncbi:MAG: dioxygenase [Proteobacteria bacterium]|nr:dioxygenase [Pseudomonadota bacterium]
MNTLPLPTLYLSHGSPMTALEPGEAGAFLRRLGPAIDAAFGRPRAVLALSAHTLTREPVLLAGAQHEAVHDFSGFPQALYELRYDAPGAPELALRVQALLAEGGIHSHRVDEGGLDHGIWTPLRYAYPDADVPVLPLGFSPQWAPQRLLALGHALAPLADEGVLIIGSGSLTHNLRLLFGAAGRPPVDAPEIDASAEFRRWVAERAAAADWAALNDYRRQAPHAALMHPTDEHWLPWYPAGGAAGEGAVGLRLHASVTYGSLAMDAYAFGPQAPRLQRALAEVGEPLPA